MKYKVLACDNIHPAGLAILNRIADVDERNQLTEDELAALLPTYDALLIRSQTKVTARSLAEAGKLKIIARAGVGVDNVDISAATKRGIIVVNSPEGNTIAAAEHTLGMMMALSRHIPGADQSMKNGKWDRKTFVGSELYHKCLGIVGLGKIGTHVARVAKSLGMRLAAYDPYISEERAKQMEVELYPLEKLFEISDYITLHVPLTDETRHMIDGKSLECMKDGVRIINCARGGLIDEQALADAIQQGKVAGAALDTFETEPLEDSSLQSLENKIILTPHLGASTAEAQINVAVDVAEQVSEVLQGRHAHSAINIPSMAPGILQEVQAHFSLAEKLGSFLSQLLHGAIKSAHITYHGELADKNTAPLKVAVLHGLLKPILKEGVNYVNALMLAKERGIDIQESRQSEAHDYANLLTLTVISEKETRSISGSLIGEREERIVKIDAFPISCIPIGYLLVLPHPDKPGMVGKIGKLLGDHDINISGIQLGRHAIRGEAVMVVNIDEPLPATLLAEMRAQNEFQHTRLITLN